MFNDRYGLPLGTNSQTAADLYMKAVDAMLSMNLGAEDALRGALEADEGFAMAHAALGLQLQQRADIASARQSMTQARELAPGTSPREQSFISALSLLVLSESGPAAAFPAVEQHMKEFPRDFFAANRIQLPQAMSGIPGSKERFLQRMRELEPALSDDWAFLANYGFVLQDFHELERAGSLAEQSLEMYPRNGQGIHVVAHVHYESNDHANGSSLVSRWLEDYEREAPGFCHYSWHNALFELSQGHYSRAFEIYENDILPAPTAPNKLQDAASLLWRLQLYGCSSDEPDWQALRSLAERVTAAPQSGFMAAHCAFVCTALGDTAMFGKLVDALRALAAKGHPSAGSVTLPMVQAIAAFEEGNYDQAIRLIEPLSDEIVRLGGSNAQREVFEDTLLGAYLRSGHFDKAESLLRGRLDRRPSARDYKWLAEAEAGLAQPEKAADSFKKAQALWPGAEAANPEQAALRELQASLRN